MQGYFPKQTTKELYRSTVNSLPVLKDFKWALTSLAKEPICSRTAWIYFKDSKSSQQGQNLGCLPLMYEKKMNKNVALDSAASFFFPSRYFDLSTVSEFVVNRLLSDSDKWNLGQWHDIYLFLCINISIYLHLSYCYFCLILFYSRIH